MSEFFFKAAQLRILEAEINVMKSVFALLTVILFMMGVIVLGPIYLLLYFSQQVLYLFEPVKHKHIKRVAH